MSEFYGKPVHNLSLSRDLLSLFRTTEEGRRGHGRNLCFCFYCEFVKNFIQFTGHYCYMNQRFDNNYNFNAAGPRSNSPLLGFQSLYPLVLEIGNPMFPTKQYLHIHNSLRTRLYLSLIHIQMCIRDRMIVGGVCQAGYNPYQLKSSRVPRPKPKLLLANETIHQGPNTGQEKALEYLRDYWQQ